MGDATFHSGEHVAAKPYQCEHCRVEIGKGERYFKQTGIYEGQFYTFRAHPDCEDMAQKIWAENCSGWDEGVILHEEYAAEPAGTSEWFNEFPTVAARLAPTSVERNNDPK